MSLYRELFKKWDLSRIAFEQIVRDEQTSEASVTYATFHQSVVNTAAWLKAEGLQQGDVLCVQLPKGMRLLQFLLAGIAMGVPVLPLNDRYTASEVLYYMGDVRAKLSIVLLKEIKDTPLGWSGKVYLEEELPTSFSTASVSFSSELMQRDINPENLALLLYTSGTTGQPKGAMISHANLLASIQALHAAWKWSVEDRLLHMLPLFHVHGLVVAQFGALYANACTLWMPAKWESEEVIKIWTERDISVCMMVPTIVQRILSVSQIPKLPHLRLVTSGSAPLPVPIHRAFEDRFGLPIVERYGMTEVGIVLSNPYQGRCRAGTVGFPLGDMHFKIVRPDGTECELGEVGELCIAGSAVISGYWERPDATANTIVDGWLHSGDLATLDPEGYYSIVGRSKDLIISGGFNVYPQDVERVLLELETVQDVAIVGLADEEWGEVVVAVVIGKLGLGEMQAHCQRYLAPYKRPRHLLLVEAFPRNAMGKVQKALLREYVNQQLLG